MHPVREHLEGQKWVCVHARACLHVHDLYTFGILLFHYPYLCMNKQVMQKLHKYQITMSFFVR